MQVLLTHEPASGQPGPGAAVTEKDADNRRPLDVALLTQQWPAVRLLIAAGALSKCPELDDARRELQQLLPCNDAAAKHGGLMAALVSSPCLRLAGRFSDHEEWVIAIFGCTTPTGHASN